jgi:excisionase family DNA binding protein
MKLFEIVESKTEPLHVRDVAPILGVSIQQVYKMAASGQIPSFRIASSVRFDPDEFAAWLKTKYPVRVQTPQSRSGQPTR